ncbi:hypothetical protein HY605_05310, partial [Candidatus Peregrinibacteria bacterium]|nr:hypothetical protein [Candidatus Peregrinibacteria bacterium]
MFKERFSIFKEGDGNGPESAEPAKSLSKAEVERRFKDLEQKFNALEKEIKGKTSWKGKDLDEYGGKIAIYLNAVRASLSAEYYPEDQFQTSRLMLVRTLHASYEKSGNKDERLTMIAWPGETLEKEIQAIPAEDWTDAKVAEYWNPVTSEGKINLAFAPYYAIDGVADIAFGLLRQILAKVNEYDQVQVNGPKTYKSKVSEDMRTTLARKARGIPVTYEIPWEIKPVIDIKLEFDRKLSEVKEWNDDEVKKMMELIEKGDDQDPGYAERMVLASFSASSGSLEKGADPKSSVLFNGRLKTSKVTLYQKLYERLIYLPNIDPKLAEQVFKEAEIDTRASVASQALESLLDENEETVPSGDLGKLSKEIVEGLTTVVGSESADGTAALVGSFNKGYQNFSRLIDEGGQPLSFYREQADALKKMADGLDEKLKKFEFESVTRVLSPEQQKAFAELKQIVDKTKIFERAAANA